jgi:2-(1,2-epoxy-1,2-dihydrophenyl)acetyl-CoA isomerase
MPPELVTRTLERGVLTLRLNRPEARNALDMPTATLLADHVCAAEHDPQVRAVLLCAAGGTFCVGGDLRAAHASGAPGEFLRQLTLPFHRAVHTLLTMPKPVVTVVVGVAAGGGFALALTGDLRVASRDAWFKLAYPSSGLPSDGGMTYLLPRIVGRARAQEILFTDPRIPADDAARLGIVHRVFAAESLEAESLALAQRLADGPGFVLGTTKQLLLKGLTADLALHLDAEREAMWRAGSSPAGREGIAAFLEKRPPRFRGL